MTLHMDFDKAEPAPDSLAISSFPHFLLRHSFPPMETSIFLFFALDFFFLISKKEQIKIPKQPA